MMTIIRERKNDVEWIWLNRPEVHNAFNAQMIEDLTNTFLELDNDQSVRLIVLLGKGTSFSAGADLNWMKSMKDASFEVNLQDSKKLAMMFEVMNKVSVPLIGIVHGHSFGGGTGLMSVCDYVICSDEAQFGFTEARLGLIPSVISPYVIAKIGESFARAWFLSGEKFKGLTALQMGLVHDVCPSNQIEEKTKSIISSFLKAGPRAAREAKKLVRLNCPSKQLMDETCSRIAKLRVSPEGQEGMRSLLEKTKASWIKND